MSEPWEVASNSLDWVNVGVRSFPTTNERIAEGFSDAINAAAKRVWDQAYEAGRRSILSEGGVWQRVAPGEALIGETGKAKVADVQMKPLPATPVERKPDRPKPRAATSVALWEGQAKGKPGDWDFTKWGQDKKVQQFIRARKKAGEESPIVCCKLYDPGYPLSDDDKDTIEFHKDVILNAGGVPAFAFAPFDARSLARFPNFDAREGMPWDAKWFQTAIVERGNAIQQFSQCETVCDFEGYDTPLKHYPSTGFNAMELDGLRWIFKDSQCECTGLIRQHAHPVYDAIAQAAPIEYVWTQVTHSARKPYPFTPLEERMKRAADMGVEADWRIGIWWRKPADTRRLNDWLFKYNVPYPIWIGGLPHEGEEFEKLLTVLGRVR